VMTHIFRGCGRVWRDVVGFAGSSWRLTELYYRSWFIHVSTGVSVVEHFGVEVGTWTEIQERLAIRG